MSVAIRAYDVWLVGSEEHVQRINHVSAAKAKAEYMSRISDCFPDGEPWDRLRARSAGPPATSDRLAQVGRQRALPWLAAGVRVVAAGRAGVILDALSGSVEVLFDDCRHSLPVHPGELQRESEATA